MRWVCALLLAAATIDAGAGEVYRCTDDGRVSYTDRPCADGERVQGLPAATARPPGPPATASTTAATATAAGASAVLPQFDA